MAMPLDSILYLVAVYMYVTVVAQHFCV